MKDYQTKIHDLMRECGIFWAFSNEQFEENIKKCRESGNLGQDEKVVAMEMGGFCPQSKYDYFRSEMGRLKAEEKVRKQTMSQEEKEKFIEDELRNYEGFYSADGLDEAISLLKRWGITKQEVLDVYHKRQHLYD